MCQYQIGVNSGTNSACVAYSGFRQHIRPSRQAQVHKSILAQDVSLWACLAGFAVAAGELHVAETAFAGCEEVDKLQYMAYIRQLPGRETRLAELALYRHNVTEAEAILLQVAAASWHCTGTESFWKSLAVSVRLCSDLDNVLRVKFAATSCC